MRKKTPASPLARLYVVSQHPKNSGGTASRRPKHPDISCVRQRERTLLLEPNACDYCARRLFVCSVTRTYMGIHLGSWRRTIYNVHVCLGGTRKFKSSGGGGGVFVRCGWFSELNCDWCGTKSLSDSMRTVNNGGVSSSPQRERERERFWQKDGGEHFICRWIQECWIHWYAQHSRRYCLMYGCSNHTKLRLLTTLYI